MASKSKGMRRHIKKYADKKRAVIARRAFMASMLEVMRKLDVGFAMLVRHFGLAYRREKIRARLLERSLKRNGQPVEANPNLEQQRIWLNFIIAGQLAHL